MDDNVTEALFHVTRARRSNSLADHSGLFQRIRQNHWMVVRGLEEEHGSNNIGFEYCIDNLENPQYLRAIQAHSGGAKLDAKLQRFRWTSFLYHIGSSEEVLSLEE